MRRRAVLRASLIVAAATLSAGAIAWWWPGHPRPLRTPMRLADEMPSRPSLRVTLAGDSRPVLSADVTTAPLTIPERAMLALSIGAEQSAASPIEFTVTAAEQGQQSETLSGACSIRAANRAGST